MLVEIMCDEFKDHGTPRGRIQLHAGLNTVMGSSSGSNSIGKSTFLMIIDFVFGGDDYVEKLTDVQTEVGEHIKDFYQNDELVALTKELTEMLRKNRTIDWQKKETARATMRKMVKRLLKKYKYPPEDYDFAINTVISQCELWTDNASMA